MQLGLLLTYRCNARCEHCCVEAGPKQTEVMEDADIQRYLDEAANIPYGISAVCVSGGEAFLYYDLLYRLVGHAAGRFTHVSVITNGFWATSAEAARAKLIPLRDAGLNTFIVSTSPFHTSYVDPARARQAIVTARELGLRTVIKATAPKTGPPVSKLLDRLSPLPEGVEVDEMTFMPGGRASCLPSDSFVLTPGIPHGRCPGAVFTIHPTGDVYFCCTPGAITPALKLGNARETPIHELVYAYYFGGLFTMLREKGPSAFIPSIIEAGLADRLHASYVNVCHLCTSLVSDPQMLQVIRRDAEHYEADLFQSLVNRSLREISGKQPI